MKISHAQARETGMTPSLKLALVLGLHACATAMPVSINARQQAGGAPMDTDDHHRRLSENPNEHYTMPKTVHDLQNRLVDKVSRDFSTWKDTAAETGDKKVQDEAEEADEEIACGDKGYKASTCGKNAVLSGLKTAVSESTLTAFKSGDTGQVLSAVMGIAASMTAEIPEVGPIISIALTLFGSLFDMYGTKGKPAVPAPPTIGQIQSAMRSELERFQTNDLQQYMLPTVMFGVQSRINLYQSLYFLDDPSPDSPPSPPSPSAPPPSGSGGDFVMEEFLKNFRTDVVSDICGPSTNSPRGVLHQMSIDLVKRITELPDKWKTTRAGLPAKPEDMCQADQNSDKHEDIARKVAQFQTDYTKPILDGIALYRAAAMQYLTLFGVVQEVFVQHANVSVSNMHAPPKPLIHYYPEVRAEFTIACSFDTFLEFVRATSKLVGDETGQASGFGNIKQLDDLMTQFVATSLDRPAMIWDQCSTTTCTNGDDGDVDCLVKSCNKMANKQAAFLTAVSAALGFCPGSAANLSEAIQMTEDVVLFGSVVDYHISGGEWYYTDDISDGGLASSWGQCDEKNTPNYNPPTDVQVNAKWVGFTDHTLGHSCFANFTVGADRPADSKPPPPPSPPPLPPYTYNPRRHVTITLASSEVSHQADHEADADADPCLGVYDTAAGLGGTIVIIKDLDDYDSTDLISYGQPASPDHSPQTFTRKQMVDEFERYEKSDCAFKCFGNATAAEESSWCVHFAFYPDAKPTETACKLLARREVGIFQGDVSTPLYQGGILAPFARVLDFSRILGHNDSWLIVPVHDASGVADDIPPADGEPDDPRLVRYNQRVRLQSASNGQSYLKLNKECTVAVSQPHRGELRLQQDTEQAPHPPPPSPPPPPPSPSPAPMPPNGVSLGKGPLGLSSTAQHKLQLWDWVNNTQHGLLDISSFHEGDANATPTAFRVFSLSGATASPQPLGTCLALEDDFEPETHGPYNSSTEACEAWAIDTSSWGALAYGRSFETSCASSAVGLTNCTRTCCEKTQSMIDDKADVLGLFPVRGDLSKRFDAASCTQQVNSLLYLPFEQLSPVTHRQEYVQTVTDGTRNASDYDHQYIYMSKGEAEAACIASGCEGLATDITSRPNLCLQGWFDDASVLSGVDFGWYMNETAKGPYTGQCGQPGYQNWVDKDHPNQGKGAYCRNCPAYSSNKPPKLGPDAHPFTREDTQKWSTRLAIVRMALVFPHGSSTEVKVSTDQDGPITNGDLVGFYAKSPGCDDGDKGAAECIWLPFVVPDADQTASGDNSCYVETPEGYAPSTWFKLAQW